MATISMAAFQSNLLSNKSSIRAQMSSHEQKTTDLRHHQHVGFQNQALRRSTLPLSLPLSSSTRRVVRASAPIQTSREGVKDSVEVKEEIPLTSEVGISYEGLRDKLKEGQWEAADEETRKIICVLAGEGASKRKWVYFSEVPFIPSTDLLTIDSLWRAYSNNKFGYSVQRKMWRSLNQRWKPFFLKIGWTFGENSNYKKFPLDFQWDIEAPVGHLPLTNALRGTLLFEKILSHPAFDGFDKEEMMEISEDLPTFDSKLGGGVGVGGGEGEKKISSSTESSSIGILDEVFDSSDYGF